MKTAREVVRVNVGAAEVVGFGWDSVCWV